MSEFYRETIAGKPLLRPPPRQRHEEVCSRLHEQILPLLANLPWLRILAPREAVEVSPGNVFRPDLTLLRAETSRPWLIAEVVDAADHLPDTVVKKEVFADVRLPRLWVVDPRFANVEVYRASAFGIVLDRILSAHEILEDVELVTLHLPVRMLFEEADGPII